MGGAAEFFAEPTTVEELAEIVRRANAASLPLRLLGAGSNLLVRDEGISGVVVLMSAPAFCEISNEGPLLTAGGGVRLNHVVSSAAREGLAGLESFVGVPGTIGGAIRSNTVGHGAAIGQWVRDVSVMNRDGEISTLASPDLRFSHHQSNLGDAILLTARFALEPGDATTITRQMQKLWILRRANLPTSDLGHGRLFSDPLGQTVGEIIEAAQLKGHAVGGARVCESDPNFVEVTPDASSEDVLGLIASVKSQVKTALGIELEQHLDVW